MYRRRTIMGCISDRFQYLVLKQIEHTGYSKMYKGIWLVAAAVLSGCVSNGGGESVVIRTQPGQGGQISEALIESCWKQAGIKGDLYKFLTPEEAAGIRPGGVLSKSQHAEFTACLKA
jgi:hypothetical protein